MKVYCKKLVAAALVVCMALAMTACGSKPLDGSQIVATVGEKEMTLGEANFLLRYQQVQTETYYESMLGEGIYEIQDSRIVYYPDYVLEEKAADYGVALTEEDTKAIADAAAAFLADNDENAKEQMTADQATVERILTLMTIRSKMAAAVKAEADVTVTDEEAAQRAFSYVSMSKLDDAGEELSAEDLQAAKDTLAAVAASVEAGNTMDAAAVENGMTSYPGTYGEGTESYYDAALIEALKAVKEGEVTEVVETEKELYLAVVTADVDEEATANRKETLVESAKTEYFNSTLAAWVEEYPLTVEEVVWEQVVFDRSYDIKPE